MEQHEFEKEQQHLQETVTFVQGRLDAAAQQSDQHAAAIRAMQEERMEERRMDMGGMYSAQGFADLLELSQGTHAISQMKSAQDENERNIRALLRTKDRPYFARIDFRPSDGPVRHIYIGRGTLMDDDTMQIHVYDWRVPIASVFYQYGVGPAQYEAPAGTMKGDVLLKRQYEIQRGQLQYYFDANEEILDGFLRDLLSKPAAPAMTSIVETIQRDQDRIIRDMKADLLMVQGCAGSGKTSVALHRVAYLMYQGLQKGRLTAGDILILAPNATFERYISQVLPDLGETQVQTMLLEDLLGTMLPDATLEPRSAWIESWMTAQDADIKGDMRSTRHFKGSAAFLTLLERLLHELPRKWIPFSDVLYDGQTVADRSLLRTEICNSTKKAPLGIQLHMLEKSILARIRALRPARLAKLLAFADRFPHHTEEIHAFTRMLSIRESALLLAQIRTFTRIDCTALYRRLFENRDAFARLADGLLAPDAIEPIRLATLRRLSGPEIPYEDAAGIAYLQARVHGCRAFTHLRQVVVDEAQDLDVLHATLLRMLFPNARFTVLGDIYQQLAGTAGLSLYDDLQRVLNKPASLLATLDKSFRCTREIWAFSKQFLPPDAASECFSRSGEIPTIHHAADAEALDALLLAHASECQQKGCRSIALLCKTQQDAAARYQRLRAKTSVSLVGPNDSVREGISIVSLYTAKGLEFDAVLLCDVDAAHYQGAEDRNLLYIGCTRALHMLRLYYTGDISPLLAAEKEDA